MNYINSNCKQYKANTFVLSKYTDDWVHPLKNINDDTVEGRRRSVLETKRLKYCKNYCWAILLSRQYSYHDSYTDTLFKKSNKNKKRIISRTF